MLFENETGVIERVSQGDLSELVPVTTNDEFGVIAGHTNSMIDGRRHRLQFLTALELAQEVQQNLLPSIIPPHFLRLTNGDLGVVVADASEHGVSAALLMTTVRALLRQRVTMESDFAHIFSEINKELVRDVKDSGRFVTMFFLKIESESNTLNWVRAGHEPAILYDTVNDTFLELAGDGMALGVVEDLEYQKYSHKGWTPGSVVVVGTDGIREAQNDKKEMFGLNRLQKVIRSHAAKSAEDIQKGIIEDLNIFQGEVLQEDDITLVVVKLL